VPSNSSFAGKDAELRALYDKVTLDYYKNFTNSLAQVACDTAGEAQYSLARTCQNCADDYKNWLCSVLIPRCEDWSAPGAWLQERNVNMPFADGSLTFGGNVSSEMNETRRMRLGYNSTRNPGIDPVVPNRPYKEMMPCEDLCFDIVRSCPPQLQFSCPNSPARELTYGKRDPGEVELRCNFPGAVVKLNVQGVVGVVRPGVWSVMLVVVVAAASLWL
jgi:calcium channel MID1